MIERKEFLEIANYITVALLLLITVNKRSLHSPLREENNENVSNELEYWSVLGNINVAVSNQTLSVLVLWTTWKKQIKLIKQYWFWYICL